MVRYANLAEDVSLAGTLTPDGPVQLIIDFVTPKINPFLSHFSTHLRSQFLTLPLSPFRSNDPAYSRRL